MGPAIHQPHGRRPRPAIIITRPLSTSVACTRPRVVNGPPNGPWLVPQSHIPIPHPPSHIHALPPALVLDINGWTDGWMFGPPCPPPLAAAARTHICTHVKPASSHLARSRRPQTCAVLASCRSRQSRSLSPPSPACQKRNPETRPTLQPLDAASHQHLHLGKRYLCSTAHAHVRHVRV